MSKNEDEKMSELSENLRNMRIMRGYSIKEVAANVGCAPNTIANYEKGTISPNVDMLQDLCNFYHISPNQVFGWEHCPELEDFINELNIQSFLQVFWLPEFLSCAKLSDDSVLKSWVISK